MTQEEPLSGTTTTLTDKGPNPSTVGQPVSFVVTVSPTVPAGETVTLEDASDGNAVVGSGTLTSGTVTISVSNLSAETHNIFAVYGGDATYAGSQSGQVAQVVNAVAPVVTPNTANVAANATSMIISGYGFDTTTANDSVTFDHGVTGTVTSASLTSLTVSVSGLSSLTAGTALDASVTVDGVSSGSLVQVATLAPVVTTGTTNGAYEYTPDANTILLDHFDGTTQATYLSGNVAYTPGFSGLGQAISFPSGAWAQETFSGWYNWTSYDGTSITKPSGTIELWVNPTADNVGILQMQWNDTTSPPPAGGILAMGINADGTLGLSTWSSISDNPPTDGSFPTSNMTIPLSTWTEIAFTWSPQGSYAYINGVQDGYSPLDFYPALNPTDYVYLNCWGGSAPIQMDELRISDVARTQFNVATTPKLVAANASTLTISGYGFDATTANDSVTFDHGVTGTVTSASLTSLTVSVSGLSSLTAGTALDASVTVDGVSSGSLVQVATLAPVVTTGTTNGAYEYTPDANTILLDHFDGTTQATYLSGNVAYTPGFSGLGQAISFPSGAWAQETFSGWYNWTSYDGTSITKPSGTIELWVNPTADNVGILQMQWNDTTSPPPAGGILAMGINADGTLGLSTWSSISDNPPTDGSFPTSNMTIPLSTWTEIAFTWSPQGSYAYINGVQDGYSPLDFYPALNPTDYVYLNCWGGSAPIQMDELRISDVARTQFNVATTPKLVAANASTLTISGYGFDATTANDSVTFDHGVTGTVTSASLTSLTVSVSGLSSLTAGTALDASVTVDGVSSGSLVQVATLAPVVTTGTTNGVTSTRRMRTRSCWTISMARHRPPT